MKIIRLGMLTICCAFCCLLCSCDRTHIGMESALKRYLKDSLPALTARCETTLDAAYMAQTLVGEVKDHPGWEGYPVKLYEYYTGVDKRLGVAKRGKVLMLNPSPEKLAIWIADAVFNATGSVSYEDFETIREWIQWQSGAQFPVSGVVYEDMYVPGHYEPYVFKDGVTVYIADTTMFPQVKENRTCTEEMLDFYLTLTNEDLKPNTGRYARIGSTTREMYYAAGGEAAVGSSLEGKRDQAWLDEVGRLYRKAWKSHHNELITAFAKYKLNQE
ncbi:MAG: cellulase [Bacteroidales bacterium]|jgi:hypothetical protein|nr:cellulase [Bacteroidales bacterium]